jgi:hypothetical protein
MCCNYYTNFQPAEKNHYLCHSMEILCHRTECKMMDKTEQTTNKDSQLNLKSILWAQAAEFQGP